MEYIKKLSDQLNKLTLHEYLHQSMAGWDPPRPKKVLHASDLTREEVEYCPRQWALMDIHGIKGDRRYLTTAQRYTFMMGYALQDMLVGGPLREIVLGFWYCPACKSEEFGYAPTKCACGSNHLIPKESRFTSVVSGASCGVDTLIKLPGATRLRVVEIKTMANDQFKELVAPLAEHRLRTNLYLRLIAESESPLRDKIDLSEADILYMCKGYGVKSPTVKGYAHRDSDFTPFKCYTIKRNDNQTQAMTDKARELTQWRAAAGANMLPDKICPGVECKRAKGCNVRKECFSHEGYDFYGKPSKD